MRELTKAESRLFEAIRAAYRAPGEVRFSCTPSELAETLDVSEGTVRRHGRALEALGLVQLTPHFVEPTGFGDSGRRSHYVYCYADLDGRDLDAEREQHLDELRSEIERYEADKKATIDEAKAAYRFGLEPGLVDRCHACLYRKGAACSLLDLSLIYPTRSRCPLFTPEP